jgi:NAD(P)-dependent dehydrogenase (short-subunit alcohol dehydrogenase family)
MTEKFLSLGASVVICGRRQAVLEEAAQELRKSYGSKIDTRTLNIRDPEAVDKVAEDLMSLKEPLTGLINNAAGNFISRTEDLSYRGFDAIANTVFHGTFYVTHAVGKRWIAKKQKGSIVSIVVTWVRNGAPYVVPSAMAKGGISVMTKSLASEWARYGIRLNAIAPGVIPTEGMSKRLFPGFDMSKVGRANPMGRSGTTEELALLATFLLAPNCAWLNGEIIALDGSNANATGGGFQELSAFSDQDWLNARNLIEAQNATDRAKRN